VPTPPIYETIGIDVINSSIGLARNFFLSRLNNSDHLVEDDDLPPKQRFPKPRLPPSGKISSPRKRPIREQQQMAKKKRKLEESIREDALLNGGRPGTSGTMQQTPSKPPGPGALGLGKVSLDPPMMSGGNQGDPEKDDEGTGMMSPPESL
jgi:transcriptional activator SPT7